MSKQIILSEFPTHVPKNKSGTKYWKINNQSIYNGYINRFTRAEVMHNMHNYVMENLPDNIIFNCPVTVDIIIKTVRNHGSVSRRAGKIRWKEPEQGYEPNWDEDNLTSIWTKAIRDSLVKKGIIPDDNVNFITGGYRGVEFVDTLNKREIIITIKKHDSTKN